MTKRFVLPAFVLVGLVLGSAAQAEAGLLEGLLGHHGHGCCAPEPSCCEQPAEPACCAPEPACCEPEPSCCEPVRCCRPRPLHHLKGMLHRLFHHHRCCKPACEPACCEPEPACCAPEPACCH